MSLVGPAHQLLTCLVCIMVLWANKWWWWYWDSYIVSWHKRVYRGMCGRYTRRSVCQLSQIRQTASALDSTFVWTAQRTEWTLNAILELNFVQSPCNSSVIASLRAYSSIHPFIYSIVYGYIYVSVIAGQKQAFDPLSSTKVASWSIRIRLDSVAHSPQWRRHKLIKHTFLHFSSEDINISYI